MTTNKNKYLNICGDASCLCGALKLCFSISYYIQDECRPDDIKVVPKNGIFCMKCKTICTDNFSCAQTKIINTAIDYVQFYEDDMPKNDILTVNEFAYWLDVRSPYNFGCFCKTYKQVKY